jgi:hypothetical protein
MGAPVPIYTAFYLNQAATEEMQNAANELSKLQADAANNPQDAAADAQQIAYYQQLLDSLNQLNGLVTEYRETGNPDLVPQIEAATDQLNK